MRAYDGIKAERGHGVDLGMPDFLEQARQLLSKNVPIEIKMSGSTMSPVIEDGDVITIEPIQETLLRPGDIILYNSLRDTAVIHRVVRVEKGESADRSIITRGDAASQNDLALPFHRVLGRVKLIERAGEQISVSRSANSFWATVKSWFNWLRFWS
ncbi:MAG TPA: signal peptidase I [Blastocatellia bacterium]|nr:signal peptidase I [Blastocatellia bacterium]